MDAFCGICHQFSIDSHSCFLSDSFPNQFDWHQELGSVTCALLTPIVTCAAETAQSRNRDAASQQHSYRLELGNVLVGLIQHRLNLGWLDHAIGAVLTPCIVGIHRSGHRRRLLGHGRAASFHLRLGRWQLVGARPAPRTLAVH